jgi:hypothetical protein
MAYRISVAVGDSDTIAWGFAVMRTVPFAAEMEVGNDPVAALLLGAAPFGVLLQDAASNPSPTQTASSFCCERSFMWSSSIGCGGRSAPAATPDSGVQRTALPPRTGFAGTGQASGLVPREGITVAGQRRDLTGFAGPIPLRLVTEAT